MSSIAAALRELVGLFIDDATFAASILGVIALAFLATQLLPGESLLAGAILIIGCLGVLAFGVGRAARR
jgi:hypothetical protein